MECSTFKHYFKQLNRIISKKLKQISDRPLADKPPCALAWCARRVLLPVCQQKQKQILVMRWSQSNKKLVMICDPSVQNQSHVADNINWVFHMCRKRRRWALIWCKNIYLWQLVKKLCSFECTQYRNCKWQKSRFKVFIYYYWNDYLLLNTAFLVYLNTYFMCDTWPYDS